MRLRLPDRAAWDALARANAPWAVISTPEFARGWDQDAFFASGERDVARILGYVAAVHDLHADSGRALDFGCGLGRLTRALTAHFDDVIGVDVSPEMLRQAAALSLESRVTWVAARGPDDLRSLAPVDFCLSLITLQHVATQRRIRRYVATLVSRLKPEGIAVLQVPAHVPVRIRWHPLRVASRRRPLPLLMRYEALRPYAMQLTPLAERKVVAAVRDGGGRVIEVVDDKRVGSDAVRSLSYLIRRQ